MPPKWIINSQNYWITSWCSHFHNCFIISLFNSLKLVICPNSHMFSSLSLYFFLLLLVEDTGSFFLWICHMLDFANCIYVVLSNIYSVPFPINWRLYTGTSWDIVLIFLSRVVHKWYCVLLSGDNYSAVDFLFFMLTGINIFIS